MFETTFIKYQGETYAVDIDRQIPEGNGFIYEGVICHPDRPGVQFFSVVDYRNRPAGRRDPGEGARMSTDVRLMSLEELDDVIAEQQDYLQRTDGGLAQQVAEEKLEAALAERRTRL